MALFDEFSLEKECKESSIRGFINQLKQIENQAKSSLEANGWQYIKTAERTVVFTIGEVRFSRRCYKKGNQYRYPLDEALQLKKYTRYSQSFLMQLADLATRMPYRKVVEAIWLLKGIVITKDVVLKAVKLAGELYDEKQQYDLDKLDEPIEKRKVDCLYIEGDGIMVKTSDQDVIRTELAHFVVHEGCETEYGKRQRLVKKHEILSASNRQARDQLLDYVFKRYQIHTNTLLVTNSDFGKGYSPYIFKELGKVFKCRHVHYWDKYHLFQRIRDLYRNLDQTLSQQLFKSIREHNRKWTEQILKSTLLLLEDEKKIEEFKQFCRFLLNNYTYTKERPEELKRGVGIMESQQCKIASRMKHRGMYWSKKGAETMAKLIIDIAQCGIKELFLGEWQQYHVTAKSYGSGINYLRDGEEVIFYQKQARYVSHKLSIRVR